MAVEDCERCHWWSEQGLSSRCPPHDAEWAEELMAKLAAEQQHLGDEFEKVLRGCADGSLYVKS